MASNVVYCGLCDQQSITNTSTVWCPECEEALCDSCLKHHRLSKASKNHKTIPIENFQNLPSFISDIKEHCDEHGDKYMMFCIKHDRPLCLSCVRTHNVCGDVIPLNDVIGNMKTDEVGQNIKQSMSDLLVNISTIEKDREANITDLNNQRKRCIGEIEKWRFEINKHLDLLQEKMIKQLNDVGDRATEQINESLGLIAGKQKEVTQLQLMVDNITTHATDLQIFLGIREIESRIIQNEVSLQSLLEEKGLERIDLYCTIDSKLKDILSTVQTFGMVEAKTNQSSIKIKRSKDKQAQQLLSGASRSLADIMITLQQKITTDCVSISGCCVTEDGDLLFADHCSEKGLRVFGSEGKHKYNISVKNSDVFDVTCIGNKTVAVSSGSSSKNCIDIIDLNTREIQKTIGLPGTVYGVCYNDNSLYCCVANWNIHVISLIDNTITTIDNTVLPSYSYVTIHGDKVLYTNNRSVTCRQRNGTHLWTFKDENILKEPQGISVDRTGNVYVAGENSSNVVVLSPDGKNHRQILGKEDGLTEPTVLYYNMSNNTLFVANCDKTAYIYKLA